MLKLLMGDAASTIGIQGVSPELLIDLGEVARSRGEEGAFAARLADIRIRHDKKGRLLERLDAAGLPAHE
jgi:hypothetical protein